MNTDNLYHLQSCLQKKRLDRLQKKGLNKYLYGENVIYAPKPKNEYRRKKG